MSFLLHVVALLPRHTYEKMGHSFDDLASSLGLKSTSTGLPATSQSVNGAVAAAGAAMNGCVVGTAAKRHRSPDPIRAGASAARIIQGRRSIEKLHPQSPSLHQSSKPPPHPATVTTSANTDVGAAGRHSLERSSAYSIKRSSTGSRRNSSPAAAPADPFATGAHRHGSHRCSEGNAALHNHVACSPGSGCASAGSVAGAGRTVGFTAIAPRRSVDATGGTGHAMTGGTGPEGISAVTSTPFNGHPAPHSPAVSFGRAAESVQGLVRETYVLEDFGGAPSITSLDMNSAEWNAAKGGAAVRDPVVLKAATAQLCLLCHFKAFACLLHVGWGGST